MIEKIIKMRENFDTKPKEKQGNIKIYEKISKTLTIMQKNAEGKCGIRRRKYPWSPIFANAITSVLLWRRIIRSYYQNPTPKGIYPVLHRLKISIQQCNLKYAKTQLKQAKGELKKVKVDTESLREQHLQDLASYYSTINKQSHAQIVNNIRTAETTKEHYRKIKSKISTKEYQAIHTLDIPDGQSTKTLHETVKIHQAILQYTEDIFRVTKDYKILNPKFQQYIGQFGEKQGADEILEGKMDTTQCPEDQYIQDFLQALKRPDPPPKQIGSEMTGEEFKETFRKTRENTASSPSGIHVGHYIAITHSNQLS